MPEVLTFALACFLIELTPGPNMAYLAVLSGRHGRIAGLYAVCGIAVGLGLLGAAAALGLATLLAEVPVLYGLLRWVGVVYMLYLAWDAWHEASKGPGDIDQSKFFFRGLTTNLLNPKAAAFYVTVLPNFVSAPDDGLWSWLSLAGIYVAIATAVHLSIVAASGSLAVVLEGSGKKIILARAMSVSLIVVAAWLAWATR